MLLAKFSKLLTAITILLIVFPTSTLAGGTVTKITKEKWIIGMRDIFPAYICRGNWYYRSCFDISENQCHVQVTEATESCLRQYSSQIPEELEQPKDGTEWGNKIGTCVGIIVEGTNADKRIDSEKCSDMTQWN